LAWHAACIWLKRVYTYHPNIHVMYTVMHMYVIYSILLNPLYWNDVPDNKCPRSKDDSSQVGKKMKGTCVCPVCDKVIKESTTTKRVMKPYIVRVAMKPGFTVDVLVYHHLILLSSKR